MNRYFLTLPVCLGLAAAALRPLAPTESVPQFVDITSSSGIAFRHINGDPDQKQYIFEAKGGGAGFFDFDNDGWMDILLVQGSTLGQFKQGSNHGPVLFRNKGEATYYTLNLQASMTESNGTG